VYILYRHVKCTCKHHLDISIALSPGPCRVTPLPSPLTRLTLQQASLLQARGLGVPGVGMLPPPTVGGCPTCVCVCLCVCVSARLCAGASVCLCVCMCLWACACMHVCMHVPKACNLQVRGQKQICAQKQIPTLAEWPGSWGGPHHSGVYCIQSIYLECITYIFIYASI
jgi:hypothetical protein